MSVVESQVRPESAQQPKSAVWLEQSAFNGKHVSAGLEVVVEGAEVVVVVVVGELPGGVPSSGTQVRVVESQVRPSLAQQPISAFWFEQSAFRGRHVRPGVVDVEGGAEVVVVVVVGELPGGEESTGTQLRVVESQVRPELAQQLKVAV